MISYTKTPEDIYILKFSDIVTYEELKDFLYTFLQIPDLPENIRILYDVLDAKLGLSIDELDKLLGLADIALEKLHTVKTAILVVGKLETAYSYILKKHSAGKYRQREVFNTFAAAINWLKSE